MKNKTKSKIKKNLMSILVCLGVLVIPFLVGAQGSNYGVRDLDVGLPGANKSLPEMVLGFVRSALIFLGIALLLIMMYGGVRWMFSGGDEDRVKKAKKTIGYGIIGAVIIIFAYAIVLLLFRILMGAEGGSMGGAGMGGDEASSKALWTGLLLLLLALVILTVAFFVLRYFLRKGLNLPHDLQKIVLLVTVPKEHKGGDDQKRGSTKEELQEQISQAEGLWQSIGGLKAQKGFKAWFYGRTDHVSLEIVAHKQLIYFYVVVPRHMQQYIEQQIHAQYPYAQIDLEEDYNIFSPTGVVVGASLNFTRNYVFPIKTYMKTESDPMNAITNSLSKLDDEDGAVVQFIVRSAKPEWHRKARGVVRATQQGKSLQEAVGSGGQANKMAGSALSGMGSILKTGMTTEREDDKMKRMDEKKLTPMEEKAVEGIEEKNSKAGLEINIRIVISSPSTEKAKMNLDNMTNSFSKYNIYEFGNSFKIRQVGSLDKFIDNFIYRNFDPSRYMVVNTEELASLYHFPSPGCETPNIYWLKARKAPPPVNMPKEGVILGKNIFRGKETLVRLRKDDRRRHVYTIGMTGTGKSTLIKNMAVQDIQNGDGVCYIDPHGEDVQNIMAAVPKERIEDVIYFSPADIERPIGLNMLEADTLEEMDMVTQDMIQIFYKLVTDPSMIGPMFEHYMRNAMLTLMVDKQDPGTITEIPRMFTDDEFQKYKLQFVKDPMVRAFWEKEMAQTTGQSKSDMLGYLISKVGRFIENEMIRNIIGQPKSGFDFREVMDKKKILLINLSKGQIGEVNSNLLGLIIVSKLQMAAMARADMEAEKRHDFYLYIDEFQNYITDSIATILSEARKYRLILGVAHQYIGQLVKNNDTSIRDAIFGNIGTIVSFRVGVDDAETFAKQFAPVFDEYDVMNIEKRNAYVRLMIDNEAAKPFNMGTFAPPEGNPEIASAIIELSRLKYGRDRQEVSEEILRRSKLGEAEGSDEIDFPDLEPSL